MARLRGRPTAAPPEHVQANAYLHAVGLLTAYEIASYGMTLRLRMLGLPM